MSSEVGSVSILHVERLALMGVTCVKPVQLLLTQSALGTHSLVFTNRGFLQLELFLHHFFSETLDLFFEVRFTTHDFLTIV